MKTSSVELIRLDPTEGMHLRNIHTCEVYADFIFIAKSLSIDDFEEITDEEYQEIIADREKERESENGEE